MSKPTRLAVLSIFIAPLLGLSVLSSGYAFGAEEKTVEEKIDLILKKPVIKDATVGVLAVSLIDGKLVDYNSEKLFIPASNMKLLTGAAALEILGGDYRFRTTIYGTTNITKKGVLEGNLILKGCGDPTLATYKNYGIESLLSDTIEELYNKGLRVIKGDILVDETFFDSQRLGSGWMWDDEQYGYSAQVGALSLNENVIVVRITPGKSAGDPIDVQLIPSTDYIEIINEAITCSANTKSDISVERSKAQNKILIKGEIAEGSDPVIRTRTIEEPGFYAGTVFKESLESNGIDVYGRVRSGVAKKGIELKVINSVPLSEIVECMMKNSDNFYAEQIIKTIGAEVMGAGSWSNGIKAVKQFLCDIGIDATQLRMVDGSGLSRYNLLSPQLVVNLLKYMYSETFLTSLPMAGVDGTLKNRMKGTPLEGNLKAKTGTMSGVSALSGYITTESGDVIAFSIMINNYAKSSKPIKIIEDEIAEIIYAAREVNK